MLEKSEPSRIKELFDAVEIAVFIIDVDKEGVFTYNTINSAHERLTGLDSDWIRGKKPSDLADYITPAVVKEVEKHYSDCYTQKRNVFYEEMIPFDGKETWWLTRLTPLIDDEGRVYRIIGSSSSIGDNRKKEQELLKNQEMLEAVSSMARVGGWEINLASGTVLWSQEIYKIHEVSLDHQPTLEEAISFYTQDSLPLITQAVQNAIEQGEPFDLKLQIRTATGNLKWVHAIGKAISTGGKAERVFGIFQDITPQYYLEETLRRRENALKEAQDLAHLGTYDYQYPEGEVFWSPEMFRLFYINERKDPPALNDLFQLVYPDDRQRFEDTVLDAISRKSTFDLIYRIKNKKGKIRHLHNTGKILTDNQGEVKRVIGTVLDITQRKLVADELQVLSTAVEQNSDSIVITNTLGNILYANPRFYELTGYTSKEIIGNNPRILKSGHQDEEFYKELWECISNGEVWKGEFLNKKKNGELYWEDATINPIRNSEGIIIRYVALKRDITELREAREQLKQLATTDSMTGAFNRRAGLAILDKQMHLSWRNGKALCLSFIDINNLKSVNDTYGHQEGDYLITSIAELLLKNMRVSDTLCRMGGDEFMMILPECDLHNAQKLNERLLELVRKCSALHKKPYDCGYSYGVVEYPGKEKMKPEELVLIADQRMYEQKKRLKKD